MTRQDTPPDILTIDVEEWFHGHNYLERVPPEVWGEQESRVVPNTERCLELLAHRGVQATFFVLGWVAERFPELVRRIAGAGHEIGCHSYGHPILYRMEESAFRADLERALGSLADAGTTEVAGYRAPSFSLTPAVHGFLHVLHEYGLRYDCSLFPVHHPRYGQPAAPRRIFALAGPESATPRQREGAPVAASAVTDRGGEFVVVPMTTWRLLGVNVPFAGGGYLRLLPWRAYRFLRRRALAQGLPNIIYLHPWELDDYRPEAGLSPLGRLRSQGGQGSMPRKLTRLLELGRFQTMGQYVAQRRARGELPVRRLPLC
jgi:polysaccharide deacetylase family protein (PEP-CTERM system associated)